MQPSQPKKPDEKVHHKNQSSSSDTDCVLHSFWGHGIPQSWTVLIQTSPILKISKAICVPGGSGWEKKTDGSKYLNSFQSQLSFSLSQLSFQSFSTQLLIYWSLVPLGILRLCSLTLNNEVGFVVKSSGNTNQINSRSHLYSYLVMCILIYCFPCCCSINICCLVGWIEFDVWDECFICVKILIIIILWRGLFNKN